MNVKDDLKFLWNCGLSYF